MAQNVKIKEGTFYLSSKTAEEGWEKQTFPNPQNREETLVRYHKNVSIEGTVDSVEFADDKFAGKVLKVKFTTEDLGELYLSLPVYSTGGVKATDSYFNSFVGSLQNITKGQSVKAFINNKNKDKNDRLYKNIVVLTPDNKIIKSNFSFSDVPRWESKETTDEFGDTVKEWDVNKANKFFIGVAKAAVDSFSGDTSKKEESKPAVQEASVEKPKMPF